MDTHHCTNDDRAKWKLEKRDGKSGDSDIGCEQEALRRKVESLYKSHYYPPNINMVDGLMERLLHNQFGSPQKEALNSSKSCELPITKEKHIPNCNATLTPSQYAISPVPSFGAVAEHANINQGGGVGKPLTPSEKSGMDSSETGRETCSSRFLHKETSARPITSPGGGNRRMLYKCPTCSKSFSKRENLIVHIRTHTGERPHNCQLCSKSFAQLGNLKRHIRTHTGERPHKCQLCSKSFVQQGSLKRHIRTHNGERPHKCQLCSKSFGELSNLKVHIRTHSVERPHKCQICSKSFGQLKYMRRHILTHTNERRRPDHLNKHIQPAYIGERPYACQVCSKSFRQASHLTIHMRIHTGKGPNE